MSGFNCEPFAAVCHARRVNDYLTVVSVCRSLAIVNRHNPLENWRNKRLPGTMLARENARIIIHENAIKSERSNPDKIYAIFASLNFLDTRFRTEP